MTIKAQRGLISKMRAYHKALFLVMILISQFPLQAAPRLPARLQNAEAAKRTRPERAVKAQRFSRDPTNLLQAYRATLRQLREEYGGTRDMPDVRFFLFGMEPRR